MKQTTPFEIPRQVRDAAERTLDEARSAFEQMMDATQKAVAGAEGAAKSLGADAADISRQALAFAEENVAASFDLAARLAKARTVEEVASLQKEYVEKLISAAAEQSRHLGGMVGRAAEGAARKTKK
jgi:hypothetical protein